MIEIKGAYANAVVFADSLEASAAGQIKAFCDQPVSAGSKIRIMPDVHAGKGCTIGTTMTITDKVIPNIVGVDIVNFWFTTCSPCVGELADLEALNKELAEKGGAVVGINSFTLDGDKTAISDAKNILAKKGVTYKNVWFDSKSEAGTFTSGLYTFPTTYVVDKNGNIVGEPIVGAITGKKQAETLRKLIDQAIANSKG